MHKRTLPRTRGEEEAGNAPKLQVACPTDIADVSPANTPPAAPSVTREALRTMTRLMMVLGTLLLFLNRAAVFLFSRRPLTHKYFRTANQFKRLFVFSVSSTS
jgi:hypothetical protein